MSSSSNTSVFTSLPYEANMERWLDRSKSWLQLPGTLQQSRKEFSKWLAQTLHKKWKTLEHNLIRTQFSLASKVICPGWQNIKTAGKSEFVLRVIASSPKNSRVPDYEISFCMARFKISTKWLGFHSSGIIHYGAVKCLRNYVMIRWP